MMNKSEFEDLEYCDLADQNGDELVASGTKTPSTDPDIILALKNGDHSAFDTIFHEYYSRIKTFLCVLTKSENDSEELCQEVFVGLWNNREKINHEKNFNGYIYTMARNAALNHFRSKSIRSNFSNDLNLVESEAASSEDIIYAKEVDLLVRLTVSKMPAQRKYIYELSRNENKSNDEIADQLNITKKAVEKHLRLAVADIREALKGFMSILL